MMVLCTFVSTVPVGAALALSGSLRDLDSPARQCIGTDHRLAQLTLGSSDHWQCGQQQSLPVVVPPRHQAQSLSRLLRT
jgi:hypothetical protein